MGARDDLVFGLIAIGGMASCFALGRETGYKTGREAGYWTGRACGAAEQRRRTGRPPPETDRQKPNGAPASDGSRE